MPKRQTQARGGDGETPEILGWIAPNAARRIFATFCLGGLGALLVYIAAAFPPVELGWLLFLLGAGLFALWLAARLWQVSARRLILTELELREEGGRRIFAMDNVARVDRGFFAFKPAGGFIVTLHAPDAGGSVYAPGLWRRRGLKVAVGGVTASAQAKAVADLIMVILAKRAAQGSKGA